MQENNRGGERPKIAPKPSIPSKPRYVPPVKIQQQRISQNDNANSQKKEPKPLHKELTRTRDLQNFPPPGIKTDFKEYSSEKSDFITDPKHKGIDTNVKYDAYVATYISEKCDKLTTNLDSFKKIQDIPHKAPQSPSTVCCSILSNATTECCGIINMNKKELNEKSMTKVDSVDSNSSDSGGFKDFIQLDLTKKLSPEPEKKPIESHQLHQRNVSQSELMEMRNELKQYSHERKSSLSDFKSPEVRQSFSQNKQNFVANAQALVQFLPQTEQQFIQKPAQSIERTENFHQHIAKFSSNLNKTEEVKIKPKPIIKQGQFQQSTKKLEEILLQRYEKEKVLRKNSGYLTDGESSQDIEQKMSIQKQIQQKLQADLQQTVKQIQEIQSIELRLPQNRKWSESNRSQPAIGLKHTPKARVGNFNEIDCLDPLLKKSGIYKIKCPECNAVYLGQTLRNFEIRYSEHLRAYRLKQPDKSHYAKHLLDTNHSLTPNTELEVLHICEKKQELDFLEELEIRRHLRNPQYEVVNEQLNLGSSPLINCLLK